jgi:predicted esterase
MSSRYCTPFCVSFAISVAALAQDRAVRLKELSGTKPSRQHDAERFRIILPPDFVAENKLTPIVYALHGYGGDMAGMEQIWKEPCARVGAILVVLQGSQNRDGGGFSWSGPEDAGRMIDVAKKNLQKEYQPSRFAPRVLTGMSQGAFATYSLGLRYPSTYRRLIPVAGMFKPTSPELAQPLTEAQQKAMRRWRVYVMVGVMDKQELVSNNGWLTSELNRVGAAVTAPFLDRHDPSWGLYQAIGHEFPGVGEERTDELVRALGFVLQPDADDEKNWFTVDRRWRDKALWMRAEPSQPSNAERPRSP